MEQKEITIKVCNDRIYLNPRLSIPIQKTNIPKEHLTFRSHKDIFWKVEMLNYKSDSKCLKVAVKEYSTSDIANFDKQEPKKPIYELLFDKFDWQKLEPLLSYHHKINLTEILFNIDPMPYSIGKKQAENYIITNEFSVYFSEANFILGYVTFKKRIKQLNKELDFKISNEHILDEFDNIKFWFAKKLKTKKFKVIVTITLLDNDIIETGATSQHISQITPELIDAIRCQRTLALAKKPCINNPDKSFFTAEEIFTQINSEDIEGNVFNQSEEDILNFFLEESNIRNKKQLAYLSGKKQSEKYSLRYTLNPKFGFLFFIEGVKNNHFVWELLDSNATYIWSIEKGIENIELQLKRIENEVNTVRTSGRENYKQAYRNNHRDSDLVFRIINHKGIASKLDEFPDWKSRLNEQLI